MTMDVFLWRDAAIRICRAAALCVLAVMLAAPAAQLAAQDQGASPAPPAAKEKGRPSPPAGRKRPEVTVDALSVVKIRSTAVADARTARSLGASREGTGVVIDSEGLVLTIGYLVLEAESVELFTADGRAFPATVIAYDNTSGFGLLRALRPLPIKPVQFGHSSKISNRELVLIVGFDGVAPAYVVSRRPFVGYWEYRLDEAIYTAPATVNWSGAALLNREGRLLGIGSLVVGDATGARSQVPGNMFVPIDLLKPMLGELIANGRAPGRPRPWIGVNTQEVHGNVIVTRVSPDGPADQARVRKGDVITSIAGQPVKGQSDFYSRLWASGEAGVEVSLDVLRGGRLEKVTVKSGDRGSYFRTSTTY
jgi:S1-C subfamily serine protease